MKKLTLFILALVTALAFSMSALALDFDFNGAFNQDNDVLQFNFSMAAPGAITIFSSSWDDGGFDPILAIWNADDGSFIQEQDDGGLTGSALSNGTSYDYGEWDSYYTQTLGAGDYIASITQYDNFANGSNLADGFYYDGNPNFTFDNGYGTQEYFNGVWDSSDPRTGDWAFHILNVSEASIEDGETNGVPEPSTLLLLGGGLIGLAGFRRKFKV